MAGMLVNPYDENAISNVRCNNLENWYCCKGWKAAVAKGKKQAPVAGLKCRTPIYHNNNPNGWPCDGSMMLVSLEICPPPRAPPHSVIGGKRSG